MCIRDSQILTASDDKTARLWQQAETGAWESVALEGHGNVVWSAVFSPDGRQILTASTDTTARLWQQDATGKWLNEPKLPCGFQSLAGALDYPEESDQPSRLWTISPSGQVCGIAIDTENETPRAPTFTIDLPDPPTVAAFIGGGEGADLSRALIGYEAGHTDLISLPSGKTLARYTGHGGAITHIEVAETEAGYRAALGAADGSVQMIDLPKSGAPLVARVSYTASRAVASVETARRTALDAVVPAIAVDDAIKREENLGDSNDLEEEENTNTAETSGPSPRSKALLEINASRCGLGEHQTMTLADLAGINDIRIRSDDSSLPDAQESPVTFAINDFPGLVKLEPRQRRENGGILSSHCGATRIASNWFVTASHCLDDEYDELTLIATRDDLTSPLAIRFSGNLSICHAAFGGAEGGYANDIALIRISDETALSLIHI